MEPKSDATSRPFRAAVLTASDTGAAGGRPVDASGDALCELLTAAGFAVAARAQLPDDLLRLQGAIAGYCDRGDVDLVLTTGGTGFSPRDITPEATRAVSERPAPGLAEAMRAASLSKTPLAMLSRAEAGIRGRTLIVNLPGSPKAVRECFEAIAPALPHGLAVLRGAVGQHAAGPR